MIPSEKLARVVRLFEDGKTVSASKFIGPNTVTTSGTIEERPKAASGIWGYGGDSIAVKINGEYWPSGNVQMAGA